MIMEVDFVTSDLLESEALQIDDDGRDNNCGYFVQENCDFEGERCGLCMDIIIDRGVLDCCQHWFCFGCIDNWATITNLCPLCQTEFQMITCVPVYDTIGSSKLDDDSRSSEDDWSIEGKNNSLSFPSYYIDENAVICLDGDGCKIRSGAATMEDDSNLDTSIACDSCDIWYHAFCVGFDTEETSEDTWLCPRCVAGEAAQKSDATSIQRPDSKAGPESSFMSEAALSGKLSVSVADAGETALSGKLSVSVADAGETALVVSMVGGNKWTEQVSQSFHPMLEVENVLEGGTVNLACNTPKAETPLLEKTDVQPVLGIHERELSLSCDTSAVDDTKSNGIEGEGTNDVNQESLSEVSLMEDDTMLPLASEEAVDIVGLKRKRSNNSDDVLHANDDEANKNEASVSMKKIKAEEGSEDKIHVSVPDDSQKCNPQIQASKDNTSKKLPQKEQQTIDIMSVVKGTGRRPSKGLARPNPANKVSKETECVAGLRVKKIMRRVGDDSESTVAVQKLRKEIREAVRNKSPAIEENLFDPKLLAAFRAAIASTPSETVKKLPPSALKAKKAILEKGKVRENLTKKIYADSNGKRKRAWDRDCEVEFWKHRCMGPTKPEKIATLKSVLGLLRKNPDGSGMEQSHEYEEKNPILSRLYLADTSVFPRKDDVKSLSDITRPSNSQNDKVNFTSVEKVQKPSPDDHSLKFAEPNKMASKPGVPFVHDNGFKDKVPSMKVKAALSKAQQERNPQGSMASSGSSKVDSQKATGVQSDKRIDKRKWALEVLARKNAAAGKNVAHEKNEDTAVLKGKFPLLVQLPIDMRPVLACCRNNKIPTSVRQTQLYRLTEYFLKKANLPEIRRTAETEFAVADAVNIEKAVADKANSKVVYLNLCSQEIMRRSSNKKSEVLESSSLPTPAGSVDSSKQAGEEVPTDPDVVDALRNAGLLSDSPPGSPEYKMEVVQEVNDSPVQVKDEGPDNVFEMDSIPEADIYGDFEYDLEGEDYIGTTAMSVPKLQVEENESRLKVVFSTLKSESVDDVQDCEEHRKLVNIEDPKDSSSSPKSHINACVIGPTMDSGADESCALQESVPDEEGEELSLAECEELYGPDKEPLVDKIPEEASLKLRGLTNFEAASGNEVPATNENCAASPSKEKINSSVAQTSSDGKSLNHSKKSEEVSKKDKANKDTEKQRDVASSVSKKVEAYIKEHIRPLCKSGIITTEQYRWAVAKTTDKVMKYHLNAKSANFLIKEGEKVKKLAEQYVEQSQQKEKSDPL